MRGFGSHGGHGGMNREKIKDGIIDLMKLKAADIVADFGSGDGFYSAQFAKICERVFAVDAHSGNFGSKFYEDPKIVRINVSICRKMDLSGITQAFFSNSFHDMECQDSALDFVASSLPEGGRLTMVEFKMDTLFGPPKNKRFLEEDLVKKVEAHGFRKTGGMDLKKHYAVSFEKV